MRCIIKHDNKKLRALKNTKNEKPCFIIGNGPCLRTSDLELIKDYDSFACNMIFRIFNETNWKPTYYVVQDRYVNADKGIQDLSCENLFISEYYWRKNTVNNPKAICFRGKRYRKSIQNPKFSEDIDKHIINMPTVTYSMIQIASYLGYKRIYLMGMDHDYPLIFDKAGRIIRTSNKRNHIFYDDTPSEIIADIEGMNIAYLAAKEYSQNNGIRIINVSRGGRLECFERAELEAVLENERRNGGYRV